MNHMCNILVYRDNRLRGEILNPGATKLSWKALIGFQEVRVLPQEVKRIEDIAP